MPDNLADTLFNTGRVAEAEPLMRRALTILLAFERATGHSHPNKAATVHYHRTILGALGTTPRRPRRRS